MHKYKLLVVLIFIVMFYSQSNASETVRVGYFEFTGFNNIDADGGYSGYGYDYLQEISKYTAWEYIYIPCTWASCQELLASGEIDILGSAQKTSEREKKFDFPKLESGISYAMLTVKSTDNRFAFNDYESFDNITVGVLVNSSRNKSLDGFTKEYNIKVHTVEFDTQNRLELALSEGAVDAILTSNLRKLSDERIIAAFAPSPFYFITTKGNENVLDGINKAQSIIKTSNPYFDGALFLKHYPVKKGQLLVLTKSENEYVKNSKVLNVVYDKMWYPIEYYDEDSNSFAGITADLFKLIAEDTGLKFNFIPSTDYQDAMKMVADKKVDILASIIDDSRVAQKNNIIITSPFISLKIAMIKNKNVSDKKDIVIAERWDRHIGSVYYNEITEGASRIFFDTIEECAEAVNKGHADIAYINTYIAESVMENPKYRNLGAMNMTNMSYNMSIGLSKPADKELITILNKALNNISPDEYEEIIFKNTSRGKPEMTLMTLLYTNPAEVMVVGSIFFLLIIVFLLLRNSVVQANIANASKSIFLAKMSHEIRTPINAVVGFLRLLKDEKLTSTGREYVDIIERSTITLLELVNSILDISKIESGSVQLDVKSFDIVNELDSIARLFVGSTLENNTMLISFIDPEIPSKVMGDQLKIRQILSNLLNNASKFTKSGDKIYFDISVLEKNNKKVKIRFSVKDTGIGIAKKDIKSVFNPFHQLEDSTISKQRGTGLGLTISNDFVKLMGGSIGVESTLGVGSEFFFTLTFDIVEDCPPREHINGKIAYIGIPKNTEKGFEKNLKVINYCTESFDTIEKLLEKDLNAFKLIIISLHFMNNDGLEILKSLRAKNKKIPILLVSYPIDTPIYSKIKELSVTVKLRPLSSIYLLKAIKELISGDVEHLSSENTNSIPTRFKGKVLVAEDDLINSRLINIVLKKYGLDVKLVDNGKKALDIYDRGFDLIFMDINMPIMDGRIAIKQIRASETKCGYSRIPIVALTANVMKGDEIEYINIGADDVLSKPYNISSLEAVLVKYLKY